MPPVCIIGGGIGHPVSMRMWENVWASVKIAQQAQCYGVRWERFVSELSFTAAVEGIMAFDNIASDANILGMWTVNTYHYNYPPFHHHHRYLFC